MQRVLVIIVTYNAMPWIDRCLSSVRHSAIKADTLIVDNGSADGTQEYIKKNYPEMELLQSKENLRFGRANNIGLRKALDCHYEYAYLLNQDAWIMPDTLQELIGVHKRNPEYGILSPMQMQADGRLLDENFARYVCRWESAPELLSHLYLNRAKEVYPVPDVMAAHWLISGKCIAAVGGFSPTFSHYGEDNNYADRVYFRGLKIGVVPAAKAVHDRQHRKHTTADKQRQLHVSHLRLLSDPARKCKHSLARCLAQCALQAFRQHSIKPLSLFLELFSKHGEIKRNLKTSIEEKGAFIQNNTSAV